MISVDFDGSWDGFRNAARGLLAHRVPAGHVRFRVQGVDPPELFRGDPPPTGGPAPRLSKRFMGMARRAVCFDAPDRWSLVYGLALRVLDDPGLAAQLIRAGRKRAATFCVDRFAAETVAAYEAALTYRS